MSEAYQAKIGMPFAVLGIRTANGQLTGIEFLPLDTPTQAPRDDFTRRVCAQLRAWRADPDFHFDVPLALAGTEHQMKVWRAMQAIPRGAVLTYGDIAARLHSSPRAVGRACGDNPIPIIVPCHRVVAKNGKGGFMHHASGAPLAIKDWLLAHEGRAS